MRQRHWNAFLRCSCVVIQRSNQARFVARPNCCAPTLPELSASSFHFGVQVHISPRLFSLSVVAVSWLPGDQLAPSSESRSTPIGWYVGTLVCENLPNIRTRLLQPSTSLSCLSKVVCSQSIRACPLALASPAAHEFSVSCAVLGCDLIAFAVVSPGTLSPCYRRRSCVVSASVPVLLSVSTAVPLVTVCIVLHIDPCC